MIAFFECDSAALLRTPKVYNALITTDQNLTPSRAYPVIQPTIHDSPFIYGPYGYTPYSYYNNYDPFGFNPFESASFLPKYNADGASGGAVPAVAASAAVAAEATAASRSANGPSKDDRSVIHGGSTEKPPIPLNEFGFPPSLIPLSAGNGKNPINLAPFSYNSYPLIYDQFAGYPHSPAYLPHFGVIPQTAYGGFDGTTQATVGNGNITPSNAIPDGNGNGNEAEAEAAAGAESQNSPNENSNPDDVANANGNISGPFDNESTIDRQRGNSPQASVYFDRENSVNRGGNGGGDDGNNGGFRTAASNGIGSTDRQRGSSSASSSGVRSNGKNQANNQDSFRRKSSSSSISGSTVSTSSSSATSNGSQQTRFVSGTQNGHVKA